MTQYWLVKTEPSTYSFDRLLKDKTTNWDGVRNPLARKNLRSMKKGDNVFVYHSGEGKEVVGLAKVAGEATPEPQSPAWFQVKLEADRKLESPVSLAKIKAEPALKDLGLVRQGRLSVMPVSPAAFKLILKLADAALRE